MALSCTPHALLRVLWWCALATADFGPELRAEEANFTQTREAQSGQQVPPTVTAGPVFVLRVRVMDALSGQPLGGASVDVYMNFTQTFTAVTEDEGDAWFTLPYKPRAVISAVASRGGYVSALLHITADRTPIFSSVTMSLFGLNRGNLWLFNDSVLVTSKSSGVFGSEPVVQFPSSRLNLTEDNALSSVTAFLNSPSLSTAEGALVHTTGIVRRTTGYSVVDLTPVASLSAQLSSSDSLMDVTGPVGLSLPLSESCGLQEGDHVPAWTLNHTTGGWMRRGLGTVESVDGRLVWTFAAPHLGHWMAAPLSPCRGVRFENQVDFILRHGSFLMILLGSTLVVAVCLLIGLLCRPKPSQRETKLRSPAVNPLLFMKDQSTSTCDDRSFLQSNGIDNNEFNICNYENNVIANPNIELHQTKDPTVDYPNQEMQNEMQNFGNGLLFYNQPVAILHAPASFFQLDEMAMSKSATLPRTGASEIEDDFPKSQNDSKQNEKEDRKKLEVRANCGLPESISEPGTLGKTVISSQGPQAWFVSLEGKPAAEIRYAEEQRRTRTAAADSRDTSLDSGVDLSEVNQGKKEVKLERNATFVKKSSSKKRKEDKD